MKTAEQAIAQLDKTAKVSRNWAEKDGTYSEPDDGVFLPIRDVKLGFNNNQDRVRMVLETFLPRAYRRPVAREEIDRLMEFARLSLAQEGESFIRPKSTYAHTPRGPVLALFSLSHREGSARGYRADQ